MRALIVDGYNVIRLTGPYREIAEQDLEAARAALIADVAAHAAGEYSATVVFDGGGNPRSNGRPHEALGVTVVFSAYGVEADSVVEALARRHREAGTPADVVTSDAQTQWAVLGGSVARRSSGEFADEMRSTDAGWREHSRSAGTRGCVEDRIDPQVREALRRWVAGEG